MRSSARKVSIRWLQDSKPQSESGFYEVTRLGCSFERARVLATVISKERQGAFSVLVLDDCTDTISAKCIEPCGISVGDLVDFFGLLKESEGERYLLVDFARKVTDPNFEILRRLELAQAELEAGANQRVKPGPVMPAKAGQAADSQPATVSSPDRDLKKALMTLINGSDSGVPYESILTANLGFNEQQIENAVKDLLNRGEIYEPKIGIYKRLS